MLRVASEATAAGRHGRLATTIVACVSVAMVVLDLTVVNVALDEISTDFAAPLSGVQWILNGYSLATAALLLSAGSLADRLGRRGVFLVGMAVFTDRIAALRLDDVSNGPDGTALQITHERIDAPEPFAALLLELVDSRPNTNTATNATSKWLFPGTNAGQHRTENSLRADVRNLGIELLAARNAALRQLVLDCPPAVVASLLNYSYGTIDRHAAESGSRWKSYASERTHSR